MISYSGLKFHELVLHARRGDKEAMAHIICRLKPAIKRYCRRSGREDICLDLVLWLIDAVYRFPA